MPKWEWTPTVTASSAYTSGDVLGGQHTLASGPVTKQGIIRNVTIFDADSEEAEIDLEFFHGPLTGTYTDHAAFDPTDADLAKSTGLLQVTSYTTATDNSRGFLSAGEVHFDLALGPLIMVAVVRATPTYTATTDIKISVDWIPL